MQIYQHLRASPGTVKTLATTTLLESYMIRNANIIYGQINVTFPCLHVHKHERERAFTCSWTMVCRVRWTSLAIPLASPHT